ncbi:MAG TPA: hypothetical protein PLY73_15660, partial [Candidatus Ozemobacteraceae bacterium]|nr:hypothetical protein [Candidatus Ozemobacteraceae bacterium]
MNVEGGSLPARLVRWIAVCVFFFAFPLFLINLGIRHAYERNWNLHAAAVARRTGDILERLRARSEETAFAYRELKRLGERIDASADPKKAAAVLCEKLERLAPGLFEIFVVDHGKSVIWPPRLPMGVSAYQIRQLCRNIGSDGSGFVNKAFLKKNINLFTYFISDAPPFLELSSMPIQERVVEVNPAGLRTYFGFWFGRRVGLLGLMNRNALRKWQFQKLLIAKANRRKSGIRFGISRFGASSPVAESRESQRRREALAWLEDSSEDAWCVRDNRLFMKLPLDMNWRLWGEAALDVSHRGDTVLSRSGALSVILLLGLSGLSFGLFVVGWKVPIALRLRLMVLFSMATGLPLSGLAVIGYDNLQKTRDVLVESGRRQLQESLRAIEGGFL